MSRVNETHGDMLQQALEENARLRAQLQRTGEHLALLSDVNRQLSAAKSIDEILDAAPLLPQRLVPAQAAVLILLDAGRPLVARTVGDMTLLEHRAYTPPRQSHPYVAEDPPEATKLVLPLYDGNTNVGWIELFRVNGEHVVADELTLLETIGGEIAEVIGGARRRAHEALAIYQLERAIAEERARIARDIHDGIAQTLAFRRMRIDLWLDWLTSEPERLRGELLQLKRVLRDQIADLRRAIFALRPIQFDELGFSAGLRRYVLEFAEQQGWHVDVEIHDITANLTPELEAVCFRIVQEALTNAAKHASATSLVVELEHVEHGLLIKVQDNGCGFELEAHPEERPGRVGLRQMRERIAALGGTLNVRSEPDKGTEITAWLPASASNQ